MAKKYININFPFKDSLKGFFLDLTTTDADAIKSDLMHLLLTNKGERYYNPEFGTNLRKYLFEPNDSVTESQIKDDIKQTVKKYLPNLEITKITINQSDQSEYMAVVKIEYTINQGVFQQNDNIEIQI